MHLPDAPALVEYMRWRATLDCARNSVSMLAQAHFAHKRLQGMSVESMKALLLEERGIDWARDTPPFFRHGTYIKKEQYEKPAVNARTGEPVLALRTRTSMRSFELQPETAADWLLAKFWTADIEEGQAPTGATPEEGDYFYGGDVEQVEAGGGYR